MTLESVNVPEQFRQVFEGTEKVVREYFSTMKTDPTQGTITIGGDRYVLVRAESMSTLFLEQMMSMMGDEEAMRFLYRFAKVIGQSDAKAFHKKMDLHDPIEKLSAGPVHFSFSGWAYVDIHPDSSPTPDDNYFLKYDHPNTFEADSYIKRGIETDEHVCVFSAGYSAGWCSESFGINLDATEVMCRARGEEACRFIMAPTLKLKSHVKRYKDEFLID